MFVIVGPSKGCMRVASAAPGRHPTARRTGLEVRLRTASTRMKPARLNAPTERDRLTRPPALSLHVLEQPGHVLWTLGYD